MKQTIEIKSVDLVRRIREDQAARLADKSVAEVMDFFNRAAEQSKKRSGTSGAVPKSSKAFKKAPQPTMRKSHRA
jgi:hypothetical protein